MLIGTYSGCCDDDDRVYRWLKLSNRTEELVAIKNIK